MKTKNTPNIIKSNKYGDTNQEDKRNDINDEEEEEKT